MEFFDICFQINALYLFYQAVNWNLLNLFNCQKTFQNFFLAVKTFFFFGKMSHFILFLASYPLILLFCSPF